MTWPAIVFWLLIFVGTISGGPMLLYVFAAAGAFCSLQMLPGDMVGVNLLPQSVCAVFLVGKILLSQGQMAKVLNAALDPAKLGLLFLFMAYALLSAYAMPRLFSHSVEVIPVSLPGPTALEPTAANITQPAYLALSTGVALAFTLVGRRASFQRGVADLSLSTIGLAEFLAPFRNASYVLHIDDVVVGAKRVVGLMPEASLYGPACVGAATSLAILRPFFSKRLRDLAVPATIAGLVVMAVLSTSSTAYVGLAVFGAICALNWFRRLRAPSPLARTGLGWEAIAAIAAALAFLFVLTLAPTLLNPVVESVDEIVFRKPETQSYTERMMWNQMGMDAFFATDGLGVGLGSARSSNWYVAILSNTGVIGATLLGLFIARLFLLRTPSDPRAAEFVAALKLSLLPGLVMGALAGLSPDFGVFGLITSLASPMRPPLANPSASAPAGSECAAIDRLHLIKASETKILR
jgi:hypothetical protein